MWNLANTIDRDLYEHVKFICQWSRTGKDVKLIRQWSGMGKEIFGRILTSLQMELGDYSENSQV